MTIIKKITRHNATVYFTFGRFQPPTSGHELLIDRVKDEARAKGVDYYIVPSASYNFKKCKPKKFIVPAKLSKGLAMEESVDISGPTKENPLPLNVKLRYMDQMFPDTNLLDIEAIGAATIMNVIDAFQSAGYAHIVMFVGSDRVKPFTDLLLKLKIENVTVESVGQQRNASNSTGVKGVSGTKMRIAAVRGDFETVKKGMPKAIREMTDETEQEKFITSLMRDIRYGLKIDDQAASMFPDENCMEGGGKRPKFVRLKVLKHKKESSIYVLRKDERPPGYRQPKPKTAPAASKQKV